MGLFADGLTEQIDIAGIAAEMRGSLYGWFNAHIQIIDPETLVTTDAFDPMSGAGGASVPVVVWDSGANGALVQPINRADLAEFGDQNTAIQGVRIQAKMTPESIVLHSGLRVVVLDAGEDHNLERFVYAVKEGTDSSLAWGRIFDTTVVQSLIITQEAPTGGFGVLGFGEGGFGE